MQTGEWLQHGEVMQTIQEADVSDEGEEGQAEAEQDHLDQKKKVNP